MYRLDSRATATEANFVVVSSSCPSKGGTVVVGIMGDDMNRVWHGTLHGRFRGWAHSMCRACLTSVYHLLPDSTAALFMFSNGADMTG